MVIDEVIRFACAAGALKASSDRGVEGLGDLETYRILAGPEVGRAVRRSDSRKYRSGHIIVGFKDPVEPHTLTLGYSSASKVWEGRNMQVSDLVRWCMRLAAEIKDPRPVEPPGQLADLGIGEALERLPTNLIAAAFGFQGGDFFELDNAAERIVPRVER